MKTIVAVFAHSGTEDVIARHYELWKRHETDIVLMSPTDAPLKRELKGVQYIDSGNSQYSGPLAITRFKTAFNWLATLPFETFLILEYDAVVLSKEIPAPGDVFWGNWFHVNNPVWSLAFKNPFYYHCPWLLSKPTLIQLCDALRPIHNSKEGGCFDRYLGLALGASAIRHEGFGPRGYSNDPISEALIPAMTRAIQEGATMMHGIKSERVLAAAVEAYSQRKELKAEK